MKHFYIITNEQKDEGLALTRQIEAYIVKKGGSCGYSASTPEKTGQISCGAKAETEQISCFAEAETEQVSCSVTERIPPETECVLCVGGDGTLIRAARELVERQIPVLGINRGHVGYLCELDRNSVFSAIDRLLEDNYMPEKRMMLTGYCVTGGQSGPSCLALNDIVIHRSGFSQMLNLIIYVNGEYLYTYSADGIILATPTGSTAYSMSAGGPIVEPGAELLLITPISPHSLNAKSIVLDAGDEIAVEIASRRTEIDEEAEVSFDGDQTFRLSVGDRIIVRRAGMHTRILKLNKQSFLEILRKKMQGE